jgi:fused signal recognition particle receptor
MDDVIVILLIVVALFLLAIGVIGFVYLPRRGTRARTYHPQPGLDYRPGVGDDAETPRDSPTRSITTTVHLPDGADPVLDEFPPISGSAESEAPASLIPELDRPEPSASRLVRLRARLVRSQNVFGRGLLSVLSRENLDADAWEEVEEALIGADVGVGATGEIVARLKERTRVLGTRSQGELRALLAEELVAALEPDLDRTLRTTSETGGPGIVMVVGVNGTGKTTTVGKLARVLVADGRTVLLGAADTFRAAAADQLQTWGSRVGAETIRGPEGGDPASVAFDTVKQGIERRVDTVVIDTAGRLHTKVGLMDELGKVKRVIEKQAPVNETLLVLDATTGQNGLTQARVFTEVVDVTGIVLTKLDGTAKGGIVINVQRTLGLPVKLVGLGEGPDDLAPFDPEQFVDALLGE